MVKRTSMHVGSKELNMLAEIERFKPEWQSKSQAQKIKDMFWKGAYQELREIGAIGQASKEIKATPQSGNTVGPKCSLVHPSYIEEYEHGSLLVTLLTEEYHV